MRKRYSIYDITYITMFALFGLFVCWTVAHYHGPALADAFLAETVSFSDGWSLADGKDIKPDKLNQVEDSAPYKKISIFHILPQNLTEGNSLCFRSKNIFFKVKIDGATVYEPYAAKSAIYTNSYGTNWHFVTLPSDASGKMLEVEYYRVYDHGRASMDSIFLGPASGVIIRTWQDKLISFITCILLLFVALLLIIADIPINMMSDKNHELRYLGLFALSISIWCLSETHLIQFFMGDSRTMQVISCCSLMLIPIPTMLYLDAAFHLRTKWLLPAVYSLSVLEFVCCWLLHFLQIADIHETMFCSHILLAIAATILFATIFKNTFFMAEEKSKSIFRLLRTIGFCSISLAAIIDIIRYYTGNSSDSAMFVRIGLLLFIVCFGSSSLEKTIYAVKLGAQSEIISQLAYKDGLTKIGNRTAFNEHFAALEQTEATDGIGIIIFDVNNLKTVNDTLGHPAGDDMIVRASQVICTAFDNADAKCYRIGGDEFAAILQGKDLQSRYQSGIEQFYISLEQYNATPDKQYILQIAHGFAVYDGQTAATLKDIYERADSLMYENKQYLKSSVSR